MWSSLQVRTPTWPQSCAYTIAATWNICPTAQNFVFKLSQSFDGTNTNVQKNLSLSNFFFFKICLLLLAPSKKTVQYFRSLQTLTDSYQFLLISFILPRNLTHQRSSSSANQISAKILLQNLFVSFIFLGDFPIRICTI